MPGGQGKIDDNEYLAAEWYYSEIMAHDWVLDCSHTKMVSELAGWYYRDDQKKILQVPNGVASEYPRCGPYNVVAGSRKWKELMVYGRSQFAGCPPYDFRYGTEIPAIDEQDFAGIVHWASDGNFYTPGSVPTEDYLLFVGRCTPYKGLLVALQAAARAKEKLTIVPAMNLAEHRKDFEEHKSSIEEAVKQGAKVDVAFLPLTTQHHIAKRELYRRARALLFPVQCNEPFGLTIIEALLCGTPVITTHLGACPEIITQGKTGFVCRDLPDMLEAIKQVDGLDRNLIRKEAFERWHYTRAAREYLAMMGAEPGPERVKVENLAC